LPDAQSAAHLAALHPAALDALLAPAAAAAAAPPLAAAAAAAPPAAAAAAAAAAAPPPAALLLPPEAAQPAHCPPAGLRVEGRRWPGRARRLQHGRPRGHSGWGGAWTWGGSVGGQAHMVVPMGLLQQRAHVASHVRGCCSSGIVARLCSGLA